MSSPNVILETSLLCCSLGTERALKLWLLSTFMSNMTN